MHLPKSTRIVAAAAAAALALGACGSSSASTSPASGSSSGTSGSSSGTSGTTSGTSGTTSGTSGTTSGTSGSTAVTVYSPPSASVNISETGSTLLYPLFQEWQKGYHALHSNIRITPQGTGSGTGIAQAEAKTTDIGASDAYLPSSAFSQFSGIENIPVAISAQMINYNLPGVSGHVKLSPKVIAEMFYGKITKWNDPAVKSLNPGVNLPDLKVVPLHRSDGSGDTFIFSSYMAAGAPSVWKLGFNTTISWPNAPAALSADGNGGMVTTCGKTKGCIAYIGVSYRTQTQKAGLGEARIENKAGNFVLASHSTIEAGASSFISNTPTNESISLIYGPGADAYPIINYEYAIVNTKMPSASAAQAVKALLSWGLDPSNGSSGSYLDPINFNPLPASVIKLSDAQIAKIS